MAEAPFSNHDFRYHDHDDDNDIESDRIWGKAKRVRGDTEEAAKAVGGHSGIVLKSFVCYKCMSFVCYKCMSLKICEKTSFKQFVDRVDGKFENFLVYETITFRSRGFNANDG